MITPWFCKLSTKVALFLAFSLLVRDDPPPVSFPLISAKSFIDIGIPEDYHNAQNLLGNES